MPRVKDPDLHTITIRLFKEDIELAKKLAKRDGRPFHTILREACALGLRKRGVAR